jgi:hypothetical protein
MSHTYILIRVREPKYGNHFELDEHAMLPFGSAAEVTARLLALPQFTQDRFGRLVYTGYGCMYEVSLRSYPTTNPDAITTIYIEYTAPWDLLPIIDAMPDLGPFAILHEGTFQLEDPAVYRPRDLEPATTAFLQEALPRGAATGGLFSLAWQAKATGWEFRYCSLTFHSTSVICPGKAVLETLDRHTGLPRWSRSWNRSRFVAAAAKDVIIVAGNHPWIFGLSPHDGSILWRCPFDEPFQGWVQRPPVVVPSGLALVGAMRGSICAVTTDRGEIIWKTAVGGTIVNLVPVNADTVLVAWTSKGLGNLSSMDVATGQVLAQHTFPPQGNPGNLVPEFDQLAVAGRHLVCSLPDGLVRLTVPDLTECTTIKDAPTPRAFIRVVALADELVAFWHPLEPTRGEIRVFDVASLEGRYEIPVAGVRPNFTRVDPTLWACVLPGPKDGPLAAGELLFMDVASGTVRQKLPIDCRPAPSSPVAFVDMAAASPSELYVFYDSGTESDRRAPHRCLACWRRATMGAP